jgi:hypothetical protein
MACGGGGGDETDTTSSDTVGTELTCDAFCASVLANCTDDNEVYDTSESCMSACEAWAVGSSTDMTGDTLGCRTSYAKGAQSNPGNDCAKTGADGGGVCVEATGDPTCTEYCNKVMSACTDNSVQYGSAAECLDFCKETGAWEKGERGDEDVNTIGCRINFAEQATQFHAFNNCVIAGPTGGGVCGSYCDNYCSLLTGNCAGENEQFTSSEECTDACAAYEVEGELGDTSGDSFQCRLSAAMNSGNSTDECVHAGSDGGERCRNLITCAQYCTEAVAACTGPNIQYVGSMEFNSQSICESYCDFAGWLPGYETDATGNSIGCRFYHAQAAHTEDPVLHCPIAGPTGADVCGSWCDNYCDLAAQSCVADNAIFGSNEECMTACAELDDTGKINDSQGNSIQCRINYLGAPAFADPATNCSEGSPDDTIACSGDSLCQEYCATMEVNCIGDFSQFADNVECMANCAGFNSGGAQDATTGDSLQCRLYHAGAAFDEPSNHCDNAGASGGSLCVAGSEFLCGAYCELMSANCTGDNTQYLEDPCLQSCNFAIDGEVGDTSGDTIQCRTTYAELAEGAPAVNCNKAGPSGGGVCVPVEESPCGIYCDDMDKNCDSVFPTVQDCLDACPGYNTGGNVGDETGDTLQCRMTHASLAGSLPEACAEAGPSGGDACTDNLSTPCEDYCGTMAANCLTDPNDPDPAYYPYSDGIDCQVQCASWPQNGTEGQQTGNTVQCRTTYAALGAADVTQCVNALPNSTTCIEVDNGPSACIVYCSLVVSTTLEEACGPLYISNEACLAQCSSMDATGTEGDTSGDTLQCRYQYGTLAAANTEFCDEAGPSGGDLCQ